jgi:hypothetical protein
MWRRLLLFLALAASLTAEAQQLREIKTHWDRAKRRIHENYWVTIENDQVYEGPYKRYYPNGQVEMASATAP